MRKAPWDEKDGGWSLLAAEKERMRMNHVRDAYRIRQLWSGSFIIAIAIMGMGFPVVSGTAEAFEVSPPASCARETTELNRWPLRTQDLAGCPKMGKGLLVLQTTGFRRAGEEPALNRWPYAFKPTEIESDKALVVEDTHDRSKISGRPEPDLNMWPLWPKS